MHRALALAEQGRSLASPNPVVGCVLLKNHRIIGEGYHRGCGTDHAEVAALKACTEDPSGATALVTLEPCCHFGYTPPCVNALIQAKIAKVVLACLDPNPMVQGQGIEALTAAGITVQIGLCEAEARSQNASFFHYITQQKPWVIGKWALSLDGKMAVPEGEDPKLSSDDTWEQVHQLRSSVDAILIGANTVRKDNPQLTCRSQKLRSEEQRNPIRIVISRSGKLPANAQIFQNPSAATWVFSSSRLAEKLPCEVMILDQQHFLEQLLSALGQRKISRLLVEGGAKTLQQFLDKNYLHETYTYLTPHLISTHPKRSLAAPQILRFERDVLIRGIWPHRKEP